LTRIRNAAHARHRSVDIPASKIKREIARVLAEERFIDNFALYEDGKQGQLRLYLRYDEANESIIQGIRRLSKPGLRQYADKGHLPRIRRGLGVAIVSTSRGVMTDRDARRAGVGGEVLCSVW
jgi:small subunit ribosomal protein S8